MDRKNWTIWAVQAASAAKVRRQVEEVPNDLRDVQPAESDAPCQEHRRITG